MIRRRWLRVTIPCLALGYSCCEAGTLPTVEVTEKHLPSAPGRGALKLGGDTRRLPLSVTRLQLGDGRHDFARDLGALIDQQTGVITVASEGGGFNDVLMRGFADTPFFRNGLNDSLGQLAPRSLLTVEEIEILKGPIAALLGPGEPGGAVNFVTKTPQAERQQRVDAGYGSYGEWSAGVDSTGSITADPRLQYRLIAERRAGGTFRDQVDLDRWQFMPALAWESGGSRIDLSVDFVRDERLFDPGILIADNAPKIPRKRFLGDPALDEVLREGLTMQAGYRRPLSDSWQIEWQLQWQRTRLEGPAVEPGGIDGTIVEREVQQLNEVAESWVAQVEIDGTVQYRGIGHELSFGIEAIGLQEDVLLHASDTDDDPYPLDLARPRSGLPLPPLSIERQSGERRRQYALFGKDLVTLSRYWKLLLGLRFDHFDQSGRDVVSGLGYDDVGARLSPRASVLFDANSSWIAYASFSQSVDPNEGLRPDGRGLAPTHARSVETGVRWSFPDYGLQIDSAAFVIRQVNVTVDAPNNPGFEIQSAKQQNIGVELSAAWAPSDTTQMVFDYQWLDTRVFDDPTIPDGISALNAPRHQAGVSLRQRVERGGIWRGIAFGAALRYVGRRQASLDTEEAALKLDDYVRVDLYASKAFGRTLKLKLSVENLFDEHYIQGSQSDAFSLRPGAPATVWTEIMLRF